MKVPCSEGLLSPFLKFRRLRKALPHIKGRLLDFGCGDGSLAAFCAPANYLGVERNAGALRIARSAFPNYRFQQSLPETGSFDTVAALAVLEHVPDPAKLLAAFARLLSPDGLIVLTTPHPGFDWMLRAGARVGLFSQEAVEEHHPLLDAKAVSSIAAVSGLRLIHFSSFLLGGNQLFLLRPAGQGAVP
jgi:2-polyprenyl-3-methyl-5-hydroxy-6-metoxy-1,4-benzoquinol methylase